MLIPVSVVTARSVPPPGLIQWYDAAQETAYADGAHVLTIPDRSGNGNNLTGGTGPTWRNGANGYGGLPAYQFTAGTQEMAASGRVLPLTGVTILFVMDYASGRPFGLENSGSGNDGVGMYSGGYIIRNSGANYDLGINPTTGVHALRIGTNWNIEGWSINTTSISHARRSGAAWSDAGVNFHLGSAGTGDNDLTGKISEWLGFSRELTNEEFSAMFGYLRDKYGV